MIEGVVIHELKQIKDDRGMVMHMLRVDSPVFLKFGEIYFSVIKRGVVKAWKRHRLMVQNMAVPLGKIKLVIYDSRENSPSNGIIQEITTGVTAYKLITIPAMLWYGFQGLGEGDSLIANCPTIPHDPDEVERLDFINNKIPYVWGSNGC